MPGTRPPRVQILSFSKFSKCNCLGIDVPLRGQRPPMENPGSATDKGPLEDQLIQVQSLVCTKLETRMANKSISPTQQVQSSQEESFVTRMGLPKGSDGLTSTVPPGITHPQLIMSEYPSAHRGTQPATRSLRSS